MTLNCLIIDDDPSTAEELAKQLRNQRTVGLLWVPAGVGDVRVVFLSGRKEKSTVHFPGEVDFHPGSLDFFFVKSNCCYHVVCFSTPDTVRCYKGFLTIVTESAKYQVAGSLAQFQRRFPNLLAREGRSLLIPHQCPENHLLLTALIN